MKAKKEKNLIDAIQLFGDQRQISKSELHSYLIEVFKKAFSRDNENHYGNASIKPANIIVDLDLETGKIKLLRNWNIVENVEPENVNIDLPVDDKRVAKKFKVGDIYEEEINLSNLDSTKIQHIKQLLIQKTREAEKLKLYNDFIDKKGSLLSCTVYRVTENYVILDYNGVSIFMPKTEYTNNDKFVVGKPVMVYILDVEKNSKDAQVIASRNHPNFVKLLLEREVEDIVDGVIEIVNISREPGVKTKVIVSSNQTEVDPIGSIIGVKGQRIKSVIDELKGERIDIIKNSDNFSELISNTLIPGKIEGIKIVETKIKDDDKESNNLKEIIVIVEENNFLPTIGKKGVNVKLASKLLQAKIDVKTVSDANLNGLDWKKIDFSFSKFKGNKSNVNNKLLDDIINSYDFQDIVNIAEENDDEFNEMDYMLDEEKK